MHMFVMYRMMNFDMFVSVWWQRTLR